MSRNAVGLDIGTRAVRAVEVRGTGSGMSVSRFGRVLLPAGAVDHGEVQNPVAVGEAIQTLWRRLKLTTRTVRIGMSNRRVAVRVVELPAMSRDDLDGAIKLQAQDYIPIPLTEAVMDYEILEEVDNADGGRSQRVLIVAAERVSIDPLVQAVQNAHLEPVTLELNAYPLVRCLGNGSGQAEAIVDVGAGVTNVVIHQGGRIQFTRILPNFGGDDFTEAIAKGLNIGMDEAEAKKRELGRQLAKRVRETSNDDMLDDAPSFIDEDVPVDTSDDDPETSRSKKATAVDLMEPVLQRFVTEVRGSVDFYTSQPNALPVGRVVLTGGGSLLGGLREGVEGALAIKTEAGHPFEHVRMAKLNASADQVNVAERYLSVAVGLAMAGGN